MSSDRTPLIESLRRHPDPEHSTDPAVRAVIDALTELEIAPAPRAEFRAELRAQLVAVAPRVIDESAAENAAVATPPRARTAGARKATHADRPRRSFARPLTIAASVVTVLVLVLAGATWLSQKSLPGDRLYGLKRTSESVRLAFASNSTAQANDRLVFATTRVQEARKLIGRPTAMALGTGPDAGGQLNAQTARLVATTLDSANSDVRAASRQLNHNAVSEHSSAPLATLLRWAPGQLDLLSDLSQSLTSTDLRSRTTQSWQLVKAAWTRANAVRAVAHCSCMTGARSDSLGPVPCPPCAASTTPRTPTTTSSLPSSASSVSKAPSKTPAGTRHHSTAHRNGTTTGAGANHGATHAPGKGSTPSLSIPTLPKVNLPTPKASLPVSVKSCGISISLGPIGVKVGTCPTPHS